MAANVLKHVVFTTPRCMRLALSRTQHNNRQVQQRFFSAASRLRQDKYFSEAHEWVQNDSGVGTVGITDYAQDKLGEIVFVQLPDIGSELEKDGDAGVLESVKAASELCSPLSGEVVETNDKVVADPALINSGCMDEAWLFKIRLSNPEELDSLMNEEGYKKFVEDL